MKEQLDYIAKNKQLKDIKVNIEMDLKELFKELMYMRKYIELNLKAKSKIMKKFTKYTKDMNNKENYELREKIILEIEDIMTNSNLTTYSNCAVEAAKDFTIERISSEWKRLLHEL